MKPLSNLFASSSEKQDYRDITTNDEDESLALEDQTFLPGHRQRLVYSRPTTLETIRSIIVILLLISGVGLILLMAVKQVFPASLAPGSPTSMPSQGVMNPVPDILVAPCGNTPQEARDRGCVFDNIAFAWFPERCWDEDLSKSFRDIKFKFSLGPNDTDPVGQDDAYTGDYPHLFVNWEYHVMHCTYMWRKMHRAILGEGRAILDGIAKDMQHTNHCETMLLRRQEVPYDSMNTIVSVKYPDCGA